MQSQHHPLKICLVRSETLLAFVVAQPMLLIGITLAKSYGLLSSWLPLRLAAPVIYEPFHLLYKPCTTS